MLHHAHQDCLLSAISMASWKHTHTHTIEYKQKYKDLKCKEQYHSSTLTQTYTNTTSTGIKIAHTCIHTRPYSRVIGSFSLAGGAWTHFADSSLLFLLAKHLHHFIPPPPLIELLSDLLLLPAPFFSAQIQSRPFLKALILIWPSGAQSSSLSGSGWIWYYLYVCMETVRAQDWW